MLPGVRVRQWGVVATLLVLVGALPAAADALSAKVDAARGSVLPIDAGIDAVAQSSAQRQANANALGHASLAGLPCSSAGEVVGAGPSVDAIWSGFKASAAHWSLIVRSGWTVMGTGIARAANGNLYVSIVFCAKTGAAVPLPPPPPAPAVPPPPATTAAEPVRTTAPARTFVSVMGAWIESIQRLSAVEFGAMPPPVAEAGDLVAVIPIVV
jgi:hypothetical protein